MSRALFLLLSAMSSLQDKNGAEAQYRALEKRLLEADAVSAEIDIETTCNGQPPAQVKVKATWQRDNKLNYSVDVGLGATTVTQTAVSDGKQLRVTGEGKPERRAVGTDLFRILSGTLARAGAVATILYTVEFFGGKARGTLWIDVGTGLPVKRALVLTAKNEVSRYVETISKLRFNDKIDPKMFDLPPKDE